MFGYNVNYAKNPGVKYHHKVIYCPNQYKILNIYSHRSLESDIIGVTHLGAILDTYDIYSDWLKINHKGKIGYVQIVWNNEENTVQLVEPHNLDKNYDLVRDLEQKASYHKNKIIDFAKNSNTINVYEAPWTSSNVICHIAYGDKISICEKYDDWIKIIHQKKIGFMVRPRRENINENMNVIMPAMDPIKSLSENNCCVCFELISSKIALVPCGHTEICPECVDKLHQRKCPVCMLQFSQYIRL